MSKLRFEQVATFWIHPDFPEYAKFAASTVYPIFQEYKPGHELKQIISKAEDQILVGFFVSD